MPRVTPALPVLLLASTVPVWGLAQPLAVSPGAADRALLAVGGCPTFSWGAGPAHAGLRLTVHAVGEEGGLAGRPAFRVDLPAGATSWTPPADQCLSPGTYAWIVYALGDTRSEWPEPFLFTVASQNRHKAPREVEQTRKPAEPRAGAPESNTSPLFTETAGDASPMRPTSAPAITPCGAFNDVEATDPFCAFIQQAVAENLISQCSTGLFCPGNPVTRQQAARLMLRVRHGSAGGVLTGDYPSPDLAAEYRLPQDCQNGELVRWSGAEWECAPTCGDGAQDEGEECDDGNTTTEDECPYGFAFCQACDASCTVVDLTGPFCGDGNLDALYEVCDDGNGLACGTCNAACKVAQGSAAIGHIYTVSGSLITDDAGFTINDGIHPETVFAFDRDGDGVPGGIEIDILVTDNQAVIRNKIVAAVGSVGASLEVSASATGPTQVTLLADRATSLSNQAVTESVVDAFFYVDGMQGGAGGNCPVGTGCVDDHDCASHLCDFGSCEEP